MTDTTKHQDIFADSADRIASLEQQLAEVTAERDALYSQFKGIGITPYLDRMKELADRAERFKAERDERAMTAQWRQQQPTPTSCFRACVATILRMPVDEVPRACDGNSWDWDAFQDWLKPLGLQAVEVVMDRDGPVLYPIPYGVPVILTGKSPRPCPSGQHAIVAKSIGLDGFDLVHDPHEGQKWIEGDAKFVTFFAAIEPQDIAASQAEATRLAERVRVLTEAATRLDTEIRASWKAGILPAEAISGEACRMLRAALSTAPADVKETA